MRPEQEILRLLKEDDPTAVNLLFKRFYRPLVLFADAYLHDLDEAEDLVQEQFIKLWSQNAFKRITQPVLSTYLFTVIKNACINFLERKKLSLKSLDLPHLQIAQKEAQNLDKESIEVIKNALSKLPPKTRKVVECVMLNDRMYKEAAEELGVSVNTIKTLLRQGIRELRIILKGKQDLIFLLLMRKKDARLLYS